MNAVIPGSFDPLTLGHEEIIKRASKLFDKVTVLVCVNENKKPMFTLEERVAIANSALDGLDNVEVKCHVGYLYEYLFDKEDTVLVKGVRNSDDFEYEKIMADFNLKQGKTETMLITTSEKMKDVSSTKVRKILAENGNIDEFVSQNAQKMIRKFYK